MAHKFNPQEIDRLISDERFKDIDPEKVLLEAGLKEGDIFADIGAGPGFFSIPAANIVGMAGIVFAVDTQKEMLLYLRDFRNPPQNIVLLLSEEDTMPIADRDADFTLLAYMLHEVEDRDKFLSEIMRIMRPGGTLLVIEWKKQKEEKGPPEEERLSHDEVAGLLEKAGFEEISISTLNPSHYRITAKAPYLSE